jgi:hypothetical protein
MINTEKLINEIFNEYERNLNNSTVSDALGSCQYKTIEDTHIWATKLLNLIGYKQFEELIGLTYKNILTMEEIELDCYNILKDSTTVLIDDADIPITETIDYIPLLDTENKRVSLDNYIEITRDEAWDLWSAYIGPLTHMQIKDPVETPVHGPILNQAVQSDNFAIGIQLAYLTHIHGYELKNWDGYDT